LFATSGAKIERYGNAPVRGADRFSLEAVRADGSGGELPLAVTRLKDAFALGQYQQMSDDQKLSRPSFEAQDAGLRLGTDEVTYEYDRAVDGEIAYETLILVPGQPAIAQPPCGEAIRDGGDRVGGRGRDRSRRPGSTEARRHRPVPDVRAGGVEFPDLNVSPLPPGGRGARYVELRSGPVFQESNNAR
jgi:hypothetical protein